VTFPEEYMVESFGLLFRCGKEKEKEKEDCCASSDFEISIQTPKLGQIGD
jgi:hypothetical protein